MLLRLLFDVGVREMYSRLIFRFIVNSTILRFGVLAAGTFPIVGFAALVLRFLNPSWPSKGLWILIITATFLGGIGGVFLGLVDDIRATKRLYEILQSARRFLGDNRKFATKNIESSVDNLRQIRFTQGDAPRFEHYHLETRGIEEKYIIENYVCGSEDALADVVRYAGQIKKLRLFAFVHQLDGRTKSVFHFAGIPPELSDGNNLLIELPTPDFLLIEKRQSGFYLFRITKNLSYAGDTWHENLQEAKRQAAYEYSIIDMDWRDIPPKVKDGISYILEQDS